MSSIINTFQAGINLVCSSSDKNKEKAKEKVKVKRAARKALAADSLPAAAPKPIVLQDTRLHQACKRGELQGAMALIHEGGEKSLKTFDAEGYLPIHHACEQGHLELLQAIITEERSALAKLSTEEGISLLQLAVSGALKAKKEGQGDKERVFEKIVVFLVEMGAHPNERSILDPLFIRACSEKSWTLARFFLGAPEVVNVKDRFGYTALMYRIQERDWVEFLLEKGADVDHVTSDEATALSLACANNREDIAKLLLDRGANARKGICHKNGRPFSPMHLACSHGNLNLLQLLVQKGADIHEACEDGKTLFNACLLSDQSEPLIRWLISQNVQPTAANKLEIIGRHPHLLPLFQSERDKQSIARSKLLVSNHIVNPPEKTDGWNAQQLFSSDLARTIEQSGAYSREERAALVRVFSDAAEFPIDIDRAVRNIQRGVPTAVPILWQGHALFLFFCGDRVSIENRGEGSRTDQNVEVFKFDPARMNRQLMEKILQMKDQNAKKASAFFYGELLDQNNLRGSKDDFSREVEEAAAMTAQTIGNCFIANTFGTLFVAHALMSTKESDPRETRRAVLKRGRIESRLVILQSRLDYMEEFLKVFPHSQEDPLVKRAWNKMKKRVGKHPELLQNYPRVKTELVDANSITVRAKKAVASVKVKASGIKCRVRYAAAKALAS